MMILQKKAAAFFSAALLMLFVASCSQPSGPVASGDRSFGVTDPPEHSSSNFNLAVPELEGAQSGVGEVTLTWDNGGDVGSELEGGEFFPVTGTWATSTTVIKPGSGHTEIYRWDDLLGWVKIAEETDGNYTESGLADGTYYYYVKEKSKLDASGNETETFHSNPSNVLEVEVISCVNEWSITSTTNPIQNPGGAVSGYDLMQKKANNVNAAKFNLHFWLNSSCGLPTTGLTNITVKLNNPNAATNTVTATEDPLNPGRYEANGIKWNQVGIVGPYPITIKVGADVVVGTWALTTTN